jgi:hypothetical protein
MVPAPPLALNVTVSSVPWAYVIVTPGVNVSSFPYVMPVPVATLDPAPPPKPKEEQPFVAPAPPPP